MRSPSKSRAGLAQPLLALLLPIALAAPAAHAQLAQGSGHRGGGDGYSAVSRWPNPSGGGRGDNSAGLPGQRRWPPYDNRRGGPGFGGGVNWLPGAAAAIGSLPAFGGASSWPSWEQMPGASAAGPSTPVYGRPQSSASPPYSPGTPAGEPSPSGPAGQPRPEPGPPAETAGTAAGSGNVAAPTRPPVRIVHPPVKVTGLGSGGSPPIPHPPHKPPIPPVEQTPDTPAHQEPPAATTATPDPPPPAAPLAVVAPTPPEPPAAANPTPATPPDPPPLPNMQIGSPVPVTTPAADTVEIGVPAIALIVLALLVLPVRLLARAARHRWRRRTARVVLFGDRGISRMVAEKAGNEPPAIAIRLTTPQPVTILRPAA